MKVYLDWDEHYPEYTVVLPEEIKTDIGRFRHILDLPETVVMRFNAAQAAYATAEEALQKAIREIYPKLDIP